MEKCSSIMWAFLHCSSLIRIAISRRISRKWIFILRYNLTSILPIWTQKIYCLVSSVKSDVTLIVRCPSRFDDDMMIIFSGSWAIFTCFSFGAELRQKKIIIFFQLTHSTCTHKKTWFYSPCIKQMHQSGNGAIPKQGNNVYSYRSVF